MEPSLALKYELSSLVRLSGGVGFVGVQPFLVVTVVVPIVGAVDGLPFVPYFFKLERSFELPCWSNGKLIGRSAGGWEDCCNDELP